jgi:hypothetical protein
MDSDGQKAVALSRRTDLLTAQPGCASRIELAFVTIVTLWSPPRTEIGLSSPGPWRHPDAAGPLGCWAGNGNAKPSRGHERPGRARRAWRLGPHGRDAGLVPVHEHAWVEDAAADVRLPCAPRASATFGGLPRMVGKLGVFLGMSSKRNSRNLKRTGARKRRPMETDLPAYLPGATEFTEIARFLEWLYICLRHGWIGSHRYRNLVHTLNRTGRDAARRLINRRFAYGLMLPYGPKAYKLGLAASPEVPTPKKKDEPEDPDSDDDDPPPGGAPPGAPPPAPPTTYQPGLPTAGSVVEDIPF